LENAAESIVDISVIVWVVTRERKVTNVELIIGGGSNAELAEWRK